MKKKNRIIVGKGSYVTETKKKRRKKKNKNQKRAKKSDQKTKAVFGCLY
jgi:hypothetical protein